jgi:hypothetical protein
VNTGDGEAFDSLFEGRQRREHRKVKHHGILVQRQFHLFLDFPPSAQ